MTSKQMNVRLVAWKWLLCASNTMLSEILMCNILNGLKCQTNLVEMRHTHGVKILII